MELSQHTRPFRLRHLQTHQNQLKNVEKVRNKRTQTKIQVLPRSKTHSHSQSHLGHCQHRQRSIVEANVGLLPSPRPLHSQKYISITLPCQYP